MTTKTVTIAEIARELKIPPKNARGRLRNVSIPRGYRIGNSWKFHAKHKAWVKKQLAA